MRRQRIGQQWSTAGRLERSEQVRRGTHERRKHLWQHALYQPLLDVEGLEHAREAGREDLVHAVVVVQADEEDVGSLQGRGQDESGSVRLPARREQMGARTDLCSEVTQQVGRYGSHPLAVLAVVALEREDVQAVKERALPEKQEQHGASAMVGARERPKDGGRTHPRP